MPLGSGAGSPQRVSYSGFHAKARVGHVRLWASAVEELSAECNVVVTTGIRGVMQVPHEFMQAPRRAARASGRDAAGHDAIIGAMSSRRLFLLGSLAVPLPTAWAQQRRSLEDPLRLGVDNALADSGLALALQQGFGRDTGVAVQIVRSPALTLLAAVERGELDAALCNTPEAEAKLEKQTLVHDRRVVARGEFVIVGPAVKGKARDPAGIAGGKDVALALARLREMASATPGLLSFVSANDGSGTHTAEQALWRAAKAVPAAPWYVMAEPAIGLAAQARAQNAYALVERGVWAAYGGAPLAVLVDADPLLVEEVHVMRPFRANHPAAKLFVEWVGGPKGRRVAAGHRGYKAAAA